MCLGWKQFARPLLSRTLKCRATEKKREEPSGKRHGTCHLLVVIRKPGEDERCHSHRS